MAKERKRSNREAKKPKQVKPPPPPPAPFGKAASILKGSPPKTKG